MGVGVLFDTRCTNWHWRRGDTYCWADLALGGPGDWGWACICISGKAQDSERWPDPGVGAEAQCVKWFWSLVFGDVVAGL